MAKGRKGPASAQSQPISASPLPPPATNARATRSRTNAALSEPRVQVKRPLPHEEPELCIVQPKKPKNKVRFPLCLRLNSQLTTARPPVFAYPCDIRPPSKYDAH